MLQRQEQAPKCGSNEEEQEEKKTLYIFPYTPQVNLMIVHWNRLWSPHSKFVYHSCSLAHHILRNINLVLANWVAEEPTNQSSTHTWSWKCGYFSYGVHLASLVCFLLLLLLLFASCCVLDKRVVFFFSFLRWGETVHLVRRPLTGLLYQPRMIDDDDGCGAVGGMRIGRGNRSTWKTPAPVLLWPPQITHDLNWTRTRTAAVGSRRLTDWAMARRVDKRINVFVNTMYLQMKTKIDTIVWLLFII
jgi:hypothetical protein